MRGGEYQAWAFVGSGVKTDQFQSIQEAITWASEYGEWVVFERIGHGWRAVRHGGDRGHVAATAVPGSAAD